jgi:predicted metal-binding protein
VRQIESRPTVFICRDCAQTRTHRSHFANTKCTRLAEVYADSIVERPGRKTIEAQAVEHEEPSR